MKLDIGPAASGKTAWLIQQCAEHGGYIVCATQADAWRIQQIAKVMGLAIPFPLNAGEFRRGEYHGAGVSKLWIDNADRLLQAMAHVPIAGMTLTAEPANE